VNRKEDIDNDGHEAGAEYGGNGKPCKMEVFL
jgi:hypothetical protein